jgi:SMC interacting uncharacterized protein involved in chromosome segregation
MGEELPALNHQDDDGDWYDVEEVDQRIVELDKTLDDICEQMDVLLEHIAELKKQKKRLIKTHERNLREWKEDKKRIAELEAVLQEVYADVFLHKNNELHALIERTLGDEDE